MFRWFALLYLVPVLAQSAVNGVVETGSGKRIQGELRIDTDKFVITETNGTTTEVALQELKRFCVVETETNTNTLTILAPPPAHGLLGIYFNTPDCAGDFFKTRYDATIDFDWGQTAPLPDMNSNGFSVRWMARLVVPTTEHYTFHTVTDDGVRLWVNNRLIIDAWKDQSLYLVAPPVVLMAGQTNELRMEMYDARDRAFARLLWSSPTTRQTIIPTDRLIPAANVDLPFTPFNKPKYVAGVLLVNGSIIPGQIESADRSSVRVAGLPSSLSAIQVARLMFKPITSQVETNLQRGRAGVLLKNGDFVEGDFRSFKGSEIDINSVVLGSKKVNIAQATAVILREPNPVSAKFEIKTRNDGLYRANTFRLQKDTIVMADSTLPTTEIALADIMEISQGRTTR